MLRRLVIVIYWIGFIIAVVFLSFGLFVVLQIAGVITPDDTPTNLRFWMAFYVFVGLVSWGVVWITRYILTGIKGISPLAKGD